MYVDTDGTAATKITFEKVANFVIDAATIAGWFIPEGIAIRIINDEIGNGTNDFSNYSESSFVFNKLLPFFTNEVLFYADYLISPIVSLTTGKSNWKDRVYETDRGLQNILWPHTMAMGARLGAFFLEFFPENDGYYFTNYTTREGQYQWQNNMGYNWYYDAFFSLGGPIKKLIYDFKSTNADGQTKDYAVWCWKGDYWNLGPGAEIGIYVQENSKKANRGFYDIDKENLKGKTHMRVDYNGKVCEIQQTNWWITMFMPWKGQRISLDDLQVWQAVSFDIPVGTTDANGTSYIDDYSVHDNLDLFTSFKESEWNNKITNGNETNLSWGPTPPANAGWDYLNLNGTYYGAFQFYIKF